MKLHAKEILKNKADKMVDLIIDEIGPQGEKKINTSFIDKKTKTKYILRLEIESGAPETLIDPIDDEDVPEKIEDILTRLVALEIKEDADTVYDDTEIKARLDILEAKEDADTIYDDTGIKARLTVLENKVDNDTIYDDTELEARVAALEAKLENNWFLWKN